MPNSFKAKNYFATIDDFRRTCSDAICMAKSESAQEFAHEMMAAANNYGLEAYISEKQIKYLCLLADIEVPKIQ